MSTLKEQAADDIYLHFDIELPWISAALFVSLDDDGNPVGSPVDLDGINRGGVIFEQEQFDSPDGFETRVTEMQNRVEAVLVDLGKVPVARTPTRAGDYFTINAIDWEVTGIDEASNSFVTCSVKIK